MSVAVALFTRDLRVHDNPTLLAAADAAERVVPLFVLDEAILGSAYNCPNRAHFLAGSLRDLDDSLRSLGAALVTRRGDCVEEVRRLAADVGADEVFVSADVSRYAQRRASALAAALRGDGRSLHVQDAVVTAVPPGDVTPASNDHFAVFTPYFRAWSGVPQRTPLDPPEHLRLPRVRTGSIPSGADVCAGTASPDLIEGGEKAARRRLEQWLDDDVNRYGDLHDDLAAGGTSGLSAYLHFGCLSPTEVVHRAGNRSQGREEFVRQVAWRDFHHQVLAARPRCSTQDYRSHRDRWRASEQDAQAWREGRTGYPIVDAGMRQLQAEGWMHNRARLIVGSFLAKTLYLDWRVGARHFMSLLIDGDVANNQLNWQWVAGTGTDTRPNRVLNPLRQAERYDPDGDYVRRYVPELAGIEGGAVHQPWKLGTGLDYPPPMVDLREGSGRFLAARGKG